MCYWCERIEEVGYRRATRELNDQMRDFNDSAERDDPCTVPGVCDELSREFQDQDAMPR